MKKKNFVIPIFIPHSGCPHQCIFCNQNKITGADGQPTVEEVETKILSYLKTIGERSTNLLIAFYGGSFTALDTDLQTKYLKVASKYLNSSQVDGIRVSTRPDCIDDAVLDLLREYGVSQIELGIQSFDDTVLKLSLRGCDSAQAITASKLIRERGFLLGHQLMIGLPGDSLEKLIATALKSVGCKPDMARIYPTLVMNGTELAGVEKYRPLSLDEALNQTRFLLEFYREYFVRILRVGLHPPSDMGSILSGPFHPSFRFLVNTKIWGGFLSEILRNAMSDRWYFSSEDYQFAIGYKGENKVLLDKKIKLSKKSWIVKDTVYLSSGQVFKRSDFRRKYLADIMGEYGWGM